MPEILDETAAKWQRMGMADSGINPTAAALLGLLHEGPMTGGQLMAAAQKRLGPYWSMTRSQVYRELPALAQAGYVKLGKPGPRSSQPYSITPAGKRAFTTNIPAKTVSVISMGSGGVPAAKALIATAGMNPERDVNIVVAGEGAQTAAMLRNKQVDALSQFDTQYAMVENAGVKLRLLDTKEIDRYPSNGFLALEENAVGLARGYAKGTIFTINNPEAAVRILYEVFPELKPTGKDEATAVRHDTKVLQARITNWKLEKAGVKRWGENSEANYAAYAEFLLKWGVIKDKVVAQDLITNELIDEINKFDAGKIAAEAKAYKSR